MSVKTSLPDQISIGYLLTWLQVTDQFSTWWVLIRHQNAHLTYYIYEQRPYKRTLGEKSNNTHGFMVVEYLALLHTVHFHQDSRLYVFASKLEPRCNSHIPVSRYATQNSWLMAWVSSVLWPLAYRRMSYSRWGSLCKVAELFSKKYASVFSPPI